jgi:hypothetical protein
MFDSPALDHGDNIGCPATDQRGAVRPQEGQCGIGAFEVGTVPPPTATPTRTPTPSSVATGDANCSGRIDSIDAALVLQRVAGLLTPAQIAQFANCRPDANEDGTINSIDAALILQYTAGLIDDLPP